MAKWGIVGSGFITRAMLDAIALNEGSTAQCIFGRSAETRDALQAEYGIAHATASYHDLLRDPEVEAVYIGLPNHLHKDYSLEALAAGKPVLCEKSLTVTMSDAAALVAGAEKARTFFAEGLMYLSHPIHHKLLDLLRSGRFGQLRHVQGFYAADIWQVVNPAGGGTLYNLGCYPASLLHLVVQAMCGEDAFANRQLQASGNAGPDGNLRDTAVTVRFDNGVLATLHSTDGYGMAHEFTIATDLGTLRFDSNPWLPTPQGNSFTWTPYEGTPERFVADSGYDAFFHQLQMVEAAMAAGETQAKRPSPRLRDSAEIMQFLTDWQAAATT